MAKHKGGREGWRGGGGFEARLSTQVIAAESGEVAEQNEKASEQIVEEGEKASEQGGGRGGGLG